MKGDVHRYSTFSSSRHRDWSCRAPAIVVVVAGLLMVACQRMHDEPTAQSRDGDVERGRQLIRQHGCGSCHSIRGVPGARGRVGPPLNRFGERTFVAGALPNTPDNVTKWLLDPPRIRPGTAMPNFDLARAEADAITAYLLAQ